MLEDLLSPRPTQPAAGGKVFVNWGRGEGWKNAVGPIGRRHSARLAVHQLILQRVAGIPIEKFLDRHPNWNFG